SAVNVWLVGLVMLLLGMILAGGAVDWVMNPQNEAEPGKVAERDAAGDTRKQPGASGQPPDRPAGTEAEAPKKGPATEPKPGDGSGPAPAPPGRPTPPAEERKPDTPLAPQALGGSAPAPGAPLAPKEVSPATVSPGGPAP